MRKRKNKNIVIGTLCALIVGMTVGYAALSQILNINGTSMISGDFSIEFTKIDENTMVNATTTTKGGVGTTTATFTVDLEKPGSSAIYDLTVENKGSIDAILTSIEGLDESNLSEPLDIKFSLTGIEEGDSLNAGDSKSFQVKVVWNSNATSVPSKSKTLTLKLNYEQKTGTSGGEDTNIQGADKYLINNVLQSDITNPTNGLYALDTTGEVTTSTTPREYRYIGSNPDNYVKFNNELWRIIGIFDGQLKIIRKDILVSREYNDYGHDWSKASLNTYLNGEYLSGIDSSAQEMISNYTWKLGGTTTYNDITSQMFYERERGTNVSDGVPIEWVGKIALMYPSDYGFATSGGTTTNRSSCLAKELYNWNDNNFSDCKNNSWLYDRLNSQRTLTPDATYINAEYYVYDDGRVDADYPSEELGVRPSLYLNSTVQITSGTGTEIDPFILGL